MRIAFWRGVLFVLLALGLYGAFVRYTQGLGAVTNLSDRFPWGLWIGFDVLCGVGLAAGGFVIAATVYLFQLRRFEPILRPTVLTAFLGYLFVIVALLFDLGRPDRIWHPLVMWNPHSVMFEVAWCVTLYTTVLALEFSPVVFERFKLKAPLKLIRAITIPLVVVGVILSTLHQSSLGGLYLIVPGKLHPFWYSSKLPIFFFLSAIAAGLGMVIIESRLSARAYGKKMELELLSDLAKPIVVVLSIYAILRVQDLAGRGVLPLLSIPSMERSLFILEIVLGVLLPIALLSIPRVRQDAGGLYSSAILVVLGFVLNRLNVSVTGMEGFSQAGYFPSWTEVAVTMALVAGGFAVFSLAVKHLTVFPTGTLHEAYGGPSR